MRRGVDLYINGNKMDLFSFEDININDTIQDARDISKVFTAFSHSFTIPASKSNNKVLRHYYNMDILDSFDARVKADAEIKIAGVTYKQGKLSLTKASLKNGNPYSYTVVFYGKTVSMKELLGDAYLKDLKPREGTGILDSFEFEYTKDFVEDAFTRGKALSGGALVNDGLDFVFPFISSENYYFYDSNTGGVSPKDGVESRNIQPDANPPNSANTGLYYKDLKPSISIKYIIQAIEERFNIEFSEDFFNENNLPYSTLHLWLQREKGKIDKQLDVKQQTIDLTDISLTGGIDYRGLKREGTISTSLWGLPPDVDNNSIQIAKDDVYGLAAWYYSIEVDITPTGVGEYKVIIEDTNNTSNTELSSWNLVGSSGAQTLVWKPSLTNIESLPNGFKNFTPKIKIETSGGISDFTITGVRIRDYIMTEVFEGYIDDDLIGTSTFTFNSGLPVGLDGAVSIYSQFPKIKVLDFLTNLFKLFNLTAYYDESTTYGNRIIVRTLDNYYFNGKNIDLSKYVDTSKVDVNRNTLFNEINFDFNQSKSFAVSKANDLTGDDFGAEKLSNLSASLNNPTAFDGGKYDVIPSLEKMMYERMNDQDDEDDILPIQWGWSADNQEKPIKLKPLLYYPILQDTLYSQDTVGNTVKINLDFSEYDKDGVIDGSPDKRETGVYIRPSNSADDSINSSVNFGDEFDEWYVRENNRPSQNNLFFQYYRKYILSLYNRQSRVIEVTANLPSNVILNLKLNDTVVINQKEYLINSLRLNLSTGLAKMSLMNNIAYSEYFSSILSTLIETPQVQPNGDAIASVVVPENSLIQANQTVIFNDRDSGEPNIVDGNLIMPSSEISTGTNTMQIRYDGAGGLVSYSSVASFSAGAGSEESFYGGEFSSETANDIAFSSNGSVMYWCNDSGLYSKTLSTPYDVSTLGYFSTTYNNASFGVGQTGLYISDDGTDVITYNPTSGSVIKLKLSSAYNLSSATLTQSASESFLSTTSLVMSDDGTKMIYIDSSNNIVYKTLSTAWNLSTLSLTATNILTDQTYLQVSMSRDGKNILSKYGTDTLKITNLTTGWDFTTITSSTTGSVSPLSFNTKGGLSLLDNASKIVLCDESVDEQYLITLGTIGKMGDLIDNS